MGVNRIIATRINWVDSMKVFGLLLIVAGHYAVPHYRWLYIFNVQLFFIISGYLHKRQSIDIFLKKISMQLIIPMLLLGLTYNLLQAVQNFFQGTFSFEILIKSLFGIIVGYQPALSGLWFVYTLILTKVISNILSEKLKPIIAIGFLLISIYLNEYTEAIYHNCFANILLAYPLYYLGEFISKHKNRINGLSNKIILCCITITGAIGVIISGLNNETVWMYMGQYGTNMFYFLLGGISGTIMIYGICKLFLDFKNKYILH